jgi:hypothetical protein
MSCGIRPRYKAGGTPDVASRAVASSNPVSPIAKPSLSGASRGFDRPRSYGAGIARASLPALVSHEMSHARVGTHDPIGGLASVA